MKLRSRTGRSVSCARVERGRHVGAIQAEQRRTARHLDRLAELAQREREIDRRLRIHADVDAGNARLLEALKLRAHFVHARKETVFRYKTPTRSLITESVVPRSTLVMVTSDARQNARRCCL